MPRLCLLPEQVDSLGRVDKVMADWGLKRSYTYIDCHGSYDSLFGYCFGQTGIQFMFPDSYRRRISCGAYEETQITTRPDSHGVSFPGRWAEDANYFYPIHAGNRVEISISPQALNVRTLLQLTREHVTELRGRIPGLVIVEHSDLYQWDIDFPTNEDEIWEFRFVPKLRFQITKLTAVPQTGKMPKLPPATIHRKHDNGTRLSFG